MSKGSTFIPFPLQRQTQTGNLHTQCSRGGGDQSLQVFLDRTCSSLAKVPDHVVCNEQGSNVGWDAVKPTAVDNLDLVPCSLIMVATMQLSNPGQLPCRCQLQLSAWSLHCSWEPDEGRNVHCQTTLHVLHASKRLSRAFWWCRCHAAKSRAGFEI